MNQKENSLNGQTAPNRAKNGHVYDQWVLLDDFPRGITKRINLEFE